MAYGYNACGYGYGSRRRGGAGVSTPPAPFVWTLASDFEGADGATTLSDDIGAKPFTFSQSALSTVSPISGTSSLLLSAADAFVSVADSADLEFGTGQFCIQAQFRFPTLPGAGLIGTILNKYNSVAGVRSWSWGITETGHIRFVHYDTSANARVSLATTNPLAINTDYDVAVDRGPDGAIRLYAGPKGGAMVMVQKYTAIPFEGIRNTAATFKVGYGGASPIFAIVGSRVDRVRLAVGATPYGTDAGGVAI